VIRLTAVAFCIMLLLPGMSWTETPSSAGPAPELDVLGRIHFNVNVSDFETSRAFYGALGFSTLSGFPDANTVAMAKAIGIDQPTTYDGSQGGEPGGYLLHGELIGLGMGRGVIDLIEFTIPRNEEPPYPALNRLGMARAVLESADVNADHEQLAKQGMTFLSAPVRRADGTLFVILKDPDGTFLELREVPGEPDNEAGTEIHRVGAVVINVSDLERSIGWYKMFGYALTSRFGGQEGTEVANAMGFADAVHLRGAVLEQEGDGSVIELVQWLTPYDSTPPYPLPVNHLGIHRMAFTSSDIESDVAKLEATGMEMISPITPCCSGPDAWGGIIAFHDPDGTVLELAEMPFMTWLQRFTNLLRSF
jgi:catechol 2,3-dioxygenase-like lactoylglutathione lyase family enzyme